MFVSRYGKVIHGDIRCPRIRTNHPLKQIHHVPNGARFCICCVKEDNTACSACGDALNEKVEGCNNCGLKYCLHCFERYAEMCSREPAWTGDVTCPCGSQCVLQKRNARRTAAFESRADVFQNSIDRVMLKRCPSCKTPYDSFDGCCALLCPCKTHFCGLCGLRCESNADCHDHVRICPMNPSRGTYWLREEEIRKVERNQQVTRLWSFVCDMKHDKTPFLTIIAVVSHLKQNNAFLFPSRCSAVFTGIFLIYMMLAFPRTCILLIITAHALI